MSESIRLRWTPLAVETLLDLEYHGQPEVAQRIIREVARRLSRQPGIYRQVDILPGDRRRPIRARRLYLGRRLPYLLYYRYDSAAGLVEVVRILYARRKPVER